MRWGTGTSCGYLAIAAVPVATISGWPSWLGPTVAVFLAFLGKLLIWWSDSIRADAEWLHRANELKLGIDRPIDVAAVADLKARYPRHDGRASKRQVKEADYYEAKGEPSSDFLADMFRESAWWTQQLAFKAWKWAGCGTTIAAAISVLVVVTVARDADSTDFLTAYAIVVCLLASSEGAILAVKYRQLSNAAKDAFRRLDVQATGHATDSVVLTAVNDYQIARATGPLIPDRFKRMYQSSLQHTWNETLSPSRGH